MHSLIRHEFKDKFLHNEEDDIKYYEIQQFSKNLTHRYLNFRSIHNVVERSNLKQMRMFNKKLGSF